MIALSMYSGLPLPQVAWTKRRMRHSLCFFPFVGVLEGFLVAAWLWVCLSLAGFSTGFCACIGVILPVLVNGGIHMDGYVDTLDAIHSWEDKGRRLEILKDPHTGAFALIGAGLYFLGYTGFLCEYVSRVGALRQRGPLFFFLPLLCYTLERAFSGLSVLYFPKAKKEGLAATFSAAASRRVDSAILSLWVGALFALSVFLGGIPGCAAFLGVAFSQLAAFAAYYRLAVRGFGGTTGDLAGWFLQTAELAGMAALTAFVCLL